MSPHLQKITVAFEYPVYFTTGVFSPDNPDLVEAVSRREPSRLHRVFVVVERAVAEARPGLLAEIRGYAERHRDRLEMAAEPWVVEGGEVAKNDPAASARLQARLRAVGMDRQSPVLIVGGGALLDMAGYAAATLHGGFGSSASRPPCSPRTTPESASKTGSTPSARRTFWGRLRRLSPSSTTHASSRP